MFLDINDFAGAILATKPSVALVTWDTGTALMTFVQRVGPAMRAQAADTIVSRIDGGCLDSKSFSSRLRSAFTRTKASNTCLLIYQIEPFVTVAGRILNGFREQLSCMRAVVVAVRCDRKRDLVIHCPDLMDWFGLTVARAEDLGKPFTTRDVRKSIRELERRYSITTADFLKKWETGSVQGIDDGWLWKELIALNADLARDR